MAKSTRTEPLVFRDKAPAPRSDGPVDLADFRRVGRRVPWEEAGARLDRYLAGRFPFYSRETWKALIRSGQVLVDGRPAKPSFALRGGEAIRAYYPVELEPEVDLGIAIVWRQGPVMAIAKPPDLPMHEHGRFRRHTLAWHLKEACGPEWAPVHRLDRETSGLVLCAATYAARRHLIESFEKRRVEKRYEAIVRGVPAEERFTVDAPIGLLTQSKIRGKRGVTPDGDPAITHFEVLEAAWGHARLAARPVTGRTHQIRIHAAHAGHVLLGEKKHVLDETIFMEWCERGNTPRVLAAAGYKRVCLHAGMLRFVHPETGKWTEVHCPLPEDMATVWAGFLARDRGHGAEASALAASTA